MRLIRKTLPHLTILLATMFIVLVVLDNYNPQMNFVDSEVSLMFLVGLCVSALLTSIRLIALHRRGARRDSSDP